MSNSAHSYCVSVILPTFNGRKYLLDSVKSCLAQTFTDFELIIVDDGSDPETQRVVQDITALDRRIHLLRHDRNRCLPAALNTGFQAAEGTYLTWTSDDNCFLPHALEQMVAYLEKNPHTDVIYTDYCLIDERGRRRQEVEVGLPGDLGHRNCIGPCFLFRRLVYEKIGGFDVNLFGAEDYDFWLRAIERFCFEPLHESLYLYRTHPDSLTHRKSQQVQEMIEAALRKNLPHIRRHPKIAVDGYFQLSRLAWSRGEWLRAADYWQKAVLRSPGIILRRWFWRKLQY